MKLFKYFLISILFSAIDVESKVLIMTSAYNRPEFIEWQYKTFKKFLLDDYEYVVVNDAEDAKLCAKIEKQCQKFGITILRVPQEECHKNLQKGVRHWENAFNFPEKWYRVNFREGEVVQYAFDQLGFKHDDLVMMIDSDVFLIKPLSIRELMGDHHIYSQIWNPELMIFNMPKLPHKNAMIFHSGFVGSKWVDLCDFLHIYIRCHDDLKIKAQERHFVHELGQLPESALSAMGYDVKQIGFMHKYVNTINTYGVNNSLDQVQFFEKSFLNYCHGSNWGGWHSKGQTRAKTGLLREYIESVVA